MNIQNQINRLKELLNQTYLLLFKKMAEDTKPKKTLSEYAHDLKGFDASPDNQAPFDLACAETVSYLARYVVPNFPSFVGTVELNAYLKKHYKQLVGPKKDAIVVSPSRGNVHGHTGVIDKDWNILSNDSDNGKLGIYWNINKWARYYANTLGLEMNYYDLSQPL